MADLPLPPSAEDAGGDGQGGGERDAGWRKDKNGEWYAPARGRSGLLRRRGDETVEEAQARDERDRGKDKRPKPKVKTKPTATKQPAPTKLTSIELEAMLRELLCTPAAIAGMQGDTWAVSHFTTEGPVLARNLVKASEHNPWLRRKLEAAVMGDDIFVKILALFPVATALIAYSIPPIVYYLDPPFLPKATRDLFEVPDRELFKAKQKRDRDRIMREYEQERRDAEGPAPPTAAEGTETGLSEAA